MGLLSTLLKVGGIAAAPFTGGASLIPTALSAAGDVASVLGKQQQGAAQGKVTQAELQQRQDQTALSRYIAEQNAQNQGGQLDLQRKNFEIGSRGTNAKQALIGALLGGGVTPTSIGPSGASGGLLRSLNGNPDALAAIKTLASQASTAQNTPMQFEGGKLLQAPQLSMLPKVDNGGVLSTLARIGELAGAASPYLQGGGQQAGPQGLDLAKLNLIAPQVPRKPVTLDEVNL
jgi:hypothetical protein